jgi:DinB superfamily
MSTTSTQAATEREQLLAALDTSTRIWLETLSSVPDCACGVKLSDESWSILQIAEHVAAAEHGMYRAMEMAAPKTTPPDYSKDQTLTVTGTNRGNKLQAPGPSLPKGRWLTLPECLEAFKKSRARTTEMVRTADGLRGRMIKHPLLGELDCYQAVLVMAGHPHRHALQIEEIKSSEAYKRVAAYLQ